jgi:hypothetical protein
MLDLSSSVILVGLGSTRISETVQAIKFCQSQVKFHSTLYLTDSNIVDDTIETVAIDKIPTYSDYQYFVVKKLPSILLDAVSPDFEGHFLFINWDGFIVNPNAWSSHFLNYDYIGAPWPWMNHIVGNGGFCLKSKKFIKSQLEIVNKIPKYPVLNNEDLELCIMLKPYFEESGCVYASPDIGYKFSTEYGEYLNNMSFGFHDFKCQPQFKDLLNDYIDSNIN